MTRRKKNDVGSDSTGVILVELGTGVDSFRRIFVREGVKYCRREVSFVIEESYLVVRIH